MVLPVVLAEKKGGSIRFCVDSRRFSKLIEKDEYPMPRIDEPLDSLRGARYFSTINLRSGYREVPMADRDTEKAAFVTPDCSNSTLWHLVFRKGPRSMKERLTLVFCLR